MTALVMELVEGDDLSRRIARGAIPIDEALPIAKQIAEALEAAHEHAAGSSPSMSMSPTLTTPAMTQAGMILGTAAYMSPEQARGRTVDKRADIWAFGAVLFEMLTGTRAFEGEDIADTLGNVMKVEPSWQRWPASMTPRVVQVVRACLQKNPKQRIDGAQDVRLALEGAFETVAPHAAVSATQPMSVWSRALPWAVAGAALVVAGATALLGTPWLAEKPVDRPLVRLDVGVRCLPRRHAGLPKGHRGRGGAEDAPVGGYRGQEGTAAGQARQLPGSQPVS